MHNRLQYLFPFCLFVSNRNQTNNNKSVVGVIGLGVMGAAVAEVLLSNDYQVIGFNRTRQKPCISALVSLGMDFAETIADLVNRSKIILILISDDNASKEVFESSSGILSHISAGNIIVDMSTISAELSIHLSQKVRSRQFHYEPGSCSHNF